ncbi:MAG: GMC family oxidoreductase, partial [Acidobacteriota bacterium]|nr:GMC family oxidoreductase [Acidobacteriota bacterium]
LSAITKNGYGPTRKPFTGWEGPDAKVSVNAGLSNIATRTARLKPHWSVELDPNSPGNPRGIKRMVPGDKRPPEDDKKDLANDLWLDRARVFQSAVRELTKDYGLVDLAINDLTPENTPLGIPNPGMQLPTNYPQEKEIKYTEQRVTADKVIVAAGCLGSNELMLRCSQKGRGRLPNISDRVGYGFSTNGDYLAFLNKTDKRASMIRGPVTSSFAHFNTDKAGTGPDGPDSPTPPDKKLFHTIEDQGIPPAFASLFGEGLPLINNLISKGDAGPGFLFCAVWKYLKKRLTQVVSQVFHNNIERADFFKAEEERISNFMCVVAMGRESSEAQFRLGKKGETPLRISKPGGKSFWDDPVYVAIEDSLKRLGKKFRAKEDYKFYNPFLTPAAEAAGAKSIPISHPLGGCRMATSAANGVVDEFGHVFDKMKTGARPFYEGLYIADASIIPSALGVNPSLTISALSLRIADNIIGEL